MRSGKFLPLVLGLLALPGAASASLEKGSSVFAVQLSRGVADVTSNGGGNLIAFSRPEMGIQGQYWFFLADEYGLNLSAGIGYYKESETADPSTLFPIDHKETVSSWQVRVGGDRFAKLTDKLQIFAGPGIQVWGGKIEFEGAAPDPSTMRIGLNGRIGAQIMLSKSVGLMGQVGQYWGYASAEDGGAKTKWTPSGSEGAMGFSFGF